VDNVVEINKQHYGSYQKGLAGLPGISLFRFDENEHNNYQYIVMEVGADCPISRDEMVEVLHAENVRARKYFWPGCHNMHPYKQLYPHADLLLPKTIEVAERVIVLPTGTAMTEEAVDMVCQIIRTCIIR